MGDPCRKAVQERVLGSMLGGINDTTGGGWKVLVLDPFTTRVLSCSLKMSDLQECNVSVVEDLHKRREPMPLVAVYFLTPTPASVDRLLQDFATNTPLYPSVHVFFSSKVPPSELNKIKGCGTLIKVLKTLKESNLEYLMVEGHTVTTDQPEAPVLLLGDQADAAMREGERLLDSMCMRISTLLASLNEFPVIRFKKGKAAEQGDPPGANARATLTHRFAAKLLQRVDDMQQSGQLPNKETCDLLVLDRSYDPVVPFIHEWTYECMVYDLIDLDGNTYRYQGETVGGRTESKEAQLEESDSVWTELRHTFIADVYTNLATRFKEFQSKNKAARLGGAGLRDTGDMSNLNIRQLITALPQFREVLSKLATHIQISSDLRQVTNERILADVGELEQDLVLGEKNSKDMLDFIAANLQHLTSSDKVRLLACYICTHPEKLDGAKLQQWAKVARLSQADVVLLTNLALLGVAVCKNEGKPERGGSSFFGGRKATAKQEATRRKRADDGGFALFRFDPLLKDILTDLMANRLPSDQFPYLRPPAPDTDTSGPVASARTGRAGLTWTRRNQGGEGSGAASGQRRVLVFVIGGVQRSEMRVVHEVSKATGRDIILASTSVDTPKVFMEQLRHMNTSGYMYGVQ